MNKFTRLAISAASAIAAIISAQASQYTIGQTVSVQETGVSPNEIVTINSSTLGSQMVYAGVTQLKIGGSTVNSFCIDPYQWSSGSAQNYTVAELSTAPVPAMGSSAAVIVGKLWAAYYNSALTNAATAAGLQIAIWEEVAGTNFSVVGDLYGYQEMIADVTTGKDANITPADLVALTNSTYQDYVVQNVPDAGMTLVLLGLGLVAMAVVGRKARSASTTN